MLITLIVAAAVMPQTLKADYQFQGNLNSSVAGAPALSNLTGSGGSNSFVSDTVDGYSRQTLRFPFNSGVSLETNSLIPASTYTFVALFRFDQVSGNRRLAWSDPTGKGGAHIVNGRLEFENTTNTPFLANTYIQVVVVREAGGLVRAYRDGGFRVSAQDTDGDFIISPSLLKFFQDDPNPPTEASAGNLARLRVYDGALTTTQVRALDRVANATGAGEQPILFSSSRDGFAEIYTMNADGSNQRRLTNNEVNEIAPKWSPNGQKIVYMRRETDTSPYQIWIMNADGSAQTRLTNTTSNYQSPSWRPDGQKILFSLCDSSFVCDLYTMNPDGTSQAAFPLVNTANDEAAASFSPNGTKIIFVCSVSGSSFANQNICTANADGSNRQQITNTVSPVLNSDPVYSPDGTKIAFMRQSDAATIATSEIYTMNADGSGQTALTSNTVDDFRPIWSADGTKIAFTSGRDTSNVTREAEVMNADGTGVIRLTSNSRDDVVSDWRRPVAPALVSVSGRVTIPDGRGLRNATVSLTDSNGVRRIVTTSSFGFFSFDSVATGGTYVVSVSSRFYRFNSQTVQVDGNLTLTDFVGLE